MVSWFTPVRLLRRIWERDFWMARSTRTVPTQPGAGGAQIHELSNRREVWIDYVAEIGDGFDSTYTVASLLAASELSPRPPMNVTSEHGSGGGEPQELLERGHLLILGGASVHPLASNEHYEDRVIGPYRDALPAVPDDRAPHLYALPGERDRTDGLTQFRDRFCAGKEIGGWRTQQGRSFFAVALPHRWWLWGVDIPHEGLQKDQLEYFSGVGQRMEKGDRVIICTSRPCWPGFKEPGVRSQALAQLETTVIRQAGGIVALSLAGGQHHYVRYGAEDAEEPKIIFGGGGAYVRETHNLSDAFDLQFRSHRDGAARSVRYRRQATFPSRRESSAHMNKLLTFPIRNWAFTLTLGLICALYAMLFDGMTIDPTAGFRWLPGGLVLTTLLVWLGVEPNPDHPPYRRRRLRLILGTLLAISLLAVQWAVFAGAPLVLSALIPDYGYPGPEFAFLQVFMNPWLGTHFFFLAFADGLACSWAVALYLWLTNRLWGCHQRSASAAIASPDWKGFLRIHLTADGLTLYPIGIRRVCRDWEKAAESTDSTAPRWLPDGMPLESRAELIEAPIRIGAISKSQRDGERVDSKPYQVKPPPKLIHALAMNKCVLYAGNGLSAEAGLPAWRELLNSLIEEGIAREEICAEDGEALRQSLRNSPGDLVATELQHLLSPDLIRSHMIEQLKGKPSQSHRLLADLGFAGVIHAGHDNLLVQSISAVKEPLDSSDPKRLTEVLRERQPFFLQLFGSPKDRELILTRHQLRQRLNRDPALARFLGTIFRRYNLFFLGASLKSIREFLDLLELSSDERPEEDHFAFVAAAEGLDKIEVRTLERDYRVQVLAVKPSEGRSEIEEFVRELRQAVRESTVGERPHERPFLHRVVLSNIGPFAYLEVDFTEGWNVFLGDNGMGKTIILRSIAAALSGEYMEESAVKPLLRSGCQQGSIQLTVGSRSYTVELTRNDDGVVGITSKSLSPLKLERWVVLGFPALRATAGKPPEGPAFEDERRDVPIPVEDLLPILRGEPDVRLDDLQQWLINLHYVSGGKNRAAKDADRLLTRFFEVLDFVTPALRLKLHRIDRQSGEIYLETEHGVVRLADISQGTSSIICWVGTLLQRIYEVHAEESDPETSGALVLVDEIDAHMHPDWQRRLPHQLRTLFPSVQFVATTHSPLVVRSLEPQEIQHVHWAPLEADVAGILQAEFGKQEGAIWVEPRGGDGGHRFPVPADTELVIPAGQWVEAGERLTLDDVVVVANPLGHGVMMWDLEEILTGPLFNLPSTLSDSAAAFLERYREQAARDDLTEEQRLNLRREALRFGFEVASEEHHLEARTAYEMIREAVQGLIQSRTQEWTDDERDSLQQEIKVRLQEIVGGTRRPR